MASKKTDHSTTTQPAKANPRSKKQKEFKQDPVAQPVEIVPTQPTSKKSRMVKGSDEAKAWSERMREIRKLKKLGRDQQQ